MTTFKVSPNKRPLVDLAKLEAFASGADVAPAEPQAIPVQAAWDDLDDKKRSPAFSMRFTAKEQAILKHIAETTPNSMHEFCLKAVRKEIDAYLASHRIK